MKTSYHGHNGSLLAKTLAKNNPLNKKRREELIPLMSAGDISARDELVLRNSRLIIKIAGEYSYSLHSHTYDDLIMTALTAVTANLHKYKPKKGALSTFIALWARAGILKMINYKDRLVHVPVSERRHLDGKSHSKERKIKHDIRISEAMHEYRATSIYRLIGHDDNTGELTLLEVINVRHCPNADYYDGEHAEEILLRSEQERAVQKAFCELPELDQLILSIRLFEGNTLEKTRWELLERGNVGREKPDGTKAPFSRERIRHMEADALELLDMITERLLDPKIIR